uniref:Potassium channel domain-containing protein n=1 Tax=Trichogramma kaykai TaxID=54128 RepID=A0ABD2VXU2_9HYME
MHRYDEDCGDDDADDDADENDNDREDDERRRSETSTAVLAAATKVLYRSMEVPDLPAFPVPPALILPPSININKNNNGGNNNDSTTIDSEHCDRHRGPGSRRHQRHHRHHRHRGVDKMPNRPRTTSWLMQRRSNNNNNDGNDYSSSNNANNNNVNSNVASSKWQRRGGNVRVQPIFWRRVSRPQVEWKLRQAKATTDDDDDPNGNPKEIHEKITFQVENDDYRGIQRTDLVYSNELKAADETQCTSDVVTPTLTAIVKQDGLLSAATINHHYSSQLGGGGELQATSLLHVQDDALIARSIECGGGVGGSSSLLQLQHRVSCATYKSAASQTSDRVLYRLRVLPTLRDIVDEETTIKATATAAGRDLGSSGPGSAQEQQPSAKRKASRLGRYFRFLGRVALCQFGLAWLLSLWTVLGAGAFYITEGPRERAQVVGLKDAQRDLAVSLATELRLLRQEEPIYANKIKQYLVKHERMLLMAVNSGYGEGGNDGQLWTFSGCVLFAVSVITTLGFGAPVPRTDAGRTVAVIFAAIGIPAHFLLVLNLGLMLAVNLKRYSVRKKYPELERDLERIDHMPMPLWLKVAPFVVLAIYYVIGILCFGASRHRPFVDSLMFPLDFTAAGGLSTIPGHVRILYALYLEGAVTLAAIAVAILKVAATQSLTNVGLKFGLLVPV